MDGVVPPSGAAGMPAAGPTTGSGSGGATAGGGPDGAPGQEEAMDGDEEF